MKMECGICIYIEDDKDYIETETWIVYYSNLCKVHMKTAKEWQDSNLMSTMGPDDKILINGYSPYPEVLGGRWKTHPEEWFEKQDEMEQEN